MPLFRLRADRGNPRASHRLSLGLPPEQGKTPPAQNRNGRVGDTVARPDAAHVRGERVGVRPVWRPHARRSHHRGPRRHSEDSHPPRAPDRGTGTPTAPGRPVRLELKPPTAAIRAGLTPGVYPPDDTWRLPPASRSPPRGPGPPGGCCGRPIVRCVSTERAKIQRTSGIGSVTFREKPRS